jgi:predicted nucleotidyltransferase
MSLPALPRDYRDMLECLQRHGVEFLLVGGWAVAVHGHQRATKDIDLFVNPTPENAERVVRALAEFGAPLAGLSASDFAEPGLVFQIGTSLRIDVTTLIDGLDWPGAARERVLVDFDGLQVPVIGRAALLSNKRSTGRKQDLADAEALQALPGKPPA